MGWRDRAKIRRKCDYCEDYFYLRDLDEHRREECPKRPMKLCRYCRNKITAMDLERHVKVFCADVRISCDHCGKEVTRGDYTQHSEGSCPGRPRRARASASKEARAGSDRDSSVFGRPCQCGSVLIPVWERKQFKGWRCTNCNRDGWRPGDREIPAGLPGTGRRR